MRYIYLLLTIISYMENPFIALEIGNNCICFGNEKNKSGHCVIPAMALNISPLFSYFRVDSVKIGFVQTYVIK